MGHSFLEGLMKATSMILVSEIGDKTFFVAALMAMRHPRGIVLIGALGALWAMTILSAAFGWVAPNLISPYWTHNGATLLFFVFGIRSLWDAYTHEGGESAELKEVEAQMGEKSASVKKDDDSTTKKARRQAWGHLLSPVLVETFSMTFLGEWGDRSQVAIIGGSLFILFGLHSMLHLSGIEVNV